MPQNVVTNFRRSNGSIIAVNGPTMAPGGLPKNDSLRLFQEAGLVVGMSDSCDAGRGSYLVSKWHACEAQNFPNGAYNDPVWDRNPDDGLFYIPVDLSAMTLARALVICTVSVTLNPYVVSGAFTPGSYLSVQASVSTGGAYNIFDTTEFYAYGLTSRISAGLCKPVFRLITSPDSYRFRFRAQQFGAGAGALAQIEVHTIAIGADLSV